MSGYYLYPMLWGVLVDENHTEGERELETLLKSKISAGCISLPTLLALPGACELTVPSTSYPLLFWVPPWLSHWNEGRVHNSKSSEGVIPGSCDLFCNPPDHRDRRAWGTLLNPFRVYLPEFEFPLKCIIWCNFPRTNQKFPQAHFAHLSKVLSHGAQVC